MALDGSSEAEIALANMMRIAPHTVIQDGTRTTTHNPSDWVDALRKLPSACPDPALSANPFSAIAYAKVVPCFRYHRQSRFR